jgi:Mg2+-importing ATPase
MQRQVTAPGLNPKQVADLRLEYGWNEIAATGTRSILMQLFVYFTRPLIAILLVAALGDLVNAAIIVLMVSGSIALDFAQSQRSTQATERLRAIVALSATVWHQDRW